MALHFGPRRATYVDLGAVPRTDDDTLAADELRHFEAFDALYRGLCAVLYNYVPTSGHPGGSISSGRIAQALAFDTLDYDVARPEREEADVLSYAGGHKAMGLYALLALRDEIVRLGRPGFLPDVQKRLRLEDLLGFRRNPGARTPLVVSMRAKALDGHPTPATPFVRLATGASGVGLAASVGLALALRDAYGSEAPRVHVLEGEGGLTPGRVAEALAAAGTGGLDNLVLHVDWNQSSIDSDHVCREGERAGDYVQWTPQELAYLHDWNVIDVPGGCDFRQVVAAQRRALALQNGQPTAIVYRTVKGWQYGIEGRASHGAGHKLCSEGFHVALRDVSAAVPEAPLPCCEEGHKRCEAPGAQAAEVLEECLWQALTLMRASLERDRPLVQALAARLDQARASNGPTRWPMPTVRCPRNYAWPRAAPPPCVRSWGGRCRC